MAADVGDSIFGENELKELLDATPEDLQDNGLILYFRCKYERRDELKKTFNQTQQRKIELELDRIEKLRTNFTKHVENAILVGGMTRSRTAWRRFAKDRSLEEKEKVKALLEKDMTPRDRARYSHNLSVLRKVAKWTESSDPLTNTASDEDDKGYGFVVYKVILKKHAEQNLSYDDYHLDTYPVRDVLDKNKKNPLMEPCEKDSIRYFHFPANNMLWVEEAIARYYGEDRGEYNYRKASNYRKKSSNLLAREFWTAQQHGGIGDPVHARHMRSHCSFIQTGRSLAQLKYITKSLKDENAPAQNAATLVTNKSNKNFVIFMPYLHWETDKRRREMAKVMKNVTQKHRKDLRREFPHLNEQFREKFEESVEQARIKFGWRTPTEDTTKKPKQEIREYSKLGTYLLEVAKVYEAMDIEPDVRILRDNLHPHNKNPPLHARRTLDQSYYWKLENTGKRDEDQVVYRGTKAGKSIYRTTRVVMVDQLWLYVLDENTIISFFPRRWGRNKPDFSGVHKGIRAKVSHLRPGEIKSVYDLALLIMNQCSTVFFDRTKPADARPQVLDIFTNAIAHVSEMKTIAFVGFWRHLEKLHLKDPHLRDIDAIEAAARLYLDLNPEGVLLREAHDIMDELRMMTRIYLQQLRVTKHFSKTLQDLNEQQSPATSKELLRGLNRTLDDINARQTHTTLNSDANIVLPIENAERSGPQKPIPDSTLYRARNLLDDIEIRLNELQDLENNTEEITSHLKDLLSLKQQQASIIEAKAALARADESVTQGRAIMMFTIITIIFLPLSFMSSLFGMNAREFSGPSGGVMSIHQQFRIMFPISVGVIAISLALAFSTWIRNLIIFLFSTIFAALTEYSGLRWLWKICIRKHNAKGLHQDRFNLADKIYGRRERRENRKAVRLAKEKEIMKRENIPLEEVRSRRDRESSAFCGIV